jgi:hypothetical protein
MGKDSMYYTVPSRDLNTELSSRSQNTGSDRRDCTSMLRAWMFALL